MRAGPGTICSRGSVDSRPAAWYFRAARTRRRQAATLCVSDVDVAAHGVPLVSTQRTRWPVRPPCLDEFGSVSSRICCISAATYSRCAE